MTSAPGAERLAIARSEVKRACNLLIAPTPEALNTCHRSLERAVSALTEFRSRSALNWFSNRSAEHKEKHFGNQGCGLT